jgi:uncharacterized repeat protein (TIGR03803 family)
MLNGVHTAKRSMKTHLKKLLLLPALIAGLALISAGQVPAQALTTLHSFAGFPTDGAGPNGGLALSGNTLYGTTLYGSNASDLGEVFALNTDSMLYTEVYTSTNFADGGRPVVGLTLSGNTLYGITEFGGSGLSGTVFAVNNSGNNYTNIHDFAGNSGFVQHGAGGFIDTTNSDGAYPDAGLTLSGSTLFGTTESGGTNGSGTVFEVGINGLGFKNLYIFTGGKDGANPISGLILSGNTLYGTAASGGTNGTGSVFSIAIDTLAFTNLYSFTAASGPFYLTTNSDGAYPQGGLALSSNTLYGTAPTGGTNGEGTVFAIDTDGRGFTNLHTFSATSGPSYANSDGALPQGLILSGNTLYGEANVGGANGNGTVFALNTDGTGFTNLHTFSVAVQDDDISSPSYFGETNSDGVNPVGNLVLSVNTLYGAASGAGYLAEGTVFSLSLSPAGAPPAKLSLVHSGSNVILTWPTNATGYTLQSTTNLDSPVWTTVVGQFAVTNPISGVRQFFRLSQ